MDELGYLSLLEETLNEGFKKHTRNGYTYSTFGALLKFNILDSFPLLTTKKVYFKGIVEELLWFLRGSTNSKELEDKNVNIWKGNSTREYLDSVGLTDYEEGELGPIYGFQWRNFGGNYKEDLKDGVDQLRYLLEELEKSDNSRRALISAWNPQQLKEQALPPCHVLYCFNKEEDNKLNCMMFMRSSDLFLGLPFNIASTALFTYIIAKVMYMKPNKIAINITDCHIYEEHLHQVDVQLSRTPKEFPQLNIKKHIDENLSIDEKIKWIEELTYDDIEIVNYQCYDALKAPMK